MEWSGKTFPDHQKSDAGRSFMKLQNLGDIHKICISGKIFAFHRDTKYILEHLFS